VNVFQVIKDKWTKTPGKVFAALEALGAEYGPPETTPEGWRSERNWQIAIMRFPDTWRTSSQLQILLKTPLRCSAVTDAPEVSQIT
jgi:hypothetical protein